MKNKDVKKKEIKLPDRTLAAVAISLARLFTQERRYALFTEIFSCSNSEIGVVFFTEFGPIKNAK